MKPPPFEHLAPDTLDEALAARAQHPHSLVLAGGQSLLLDLRWRRARPDVVIDLNRIPGLDAVEHTDGAVRIGALVRHRALEDPRTLGGPLGALFAEAAHHVAHPPIRARGTVLGSLAWAHPAAEWCGLAAGLRGEVELAGPDGRRRLPVAEFLRGPHRTALRTGEIAVALVLPTLDPATEVAFLEARRTHASFAQLAVGVAVTRDGTTVAGARIGLANAASTGVAARAAEQQLLGTDGGPDAIRAAARAAAAQDSDPTGGAHADPDYVKHLVEVLVGRALTHALTRQQAA